MEPLRFERIATPLGPLVIVAREGRLVAVDFAEGPDLEALARRFPEVPVRRARNPAGLSARIRAYFAGDLGALDAIETDAGGTDFQQRVWTELRRVPPGTTVTYGELARRIGNPTACRAVGLANHDNPVPLVVPCHRVVGSRGELTGYAAGLDRKRRLLEHEGALLRLGVKARRPRRKGRATRAALEAAPA